MDELITRRSLQWILLAQAATGAALVLHLPLWLGGLWLFCAAWRVQIYRQRLPFPPVLFKVLLMASCVAGIWWSLGTRFTLDSAVTLLACAFVLKLVELKTTRDAWVLIALGLFCVGASFLFGDSLLNALYSLVPLVLWLVTMQTMQSAQRTGFVANDELHLSLLLIVQAVPLMLILFVAFPRFGPLWALPKSNAGITGLSESMSPGDIAELSQSSALAFRAQFKGEMPRHDQLYWRALTFDHYDGRSWSQSYGGTSAQEPEWQAKGKPWQYRVLMQPTQQPWLFVLDTAEVPLGEARLMSDFRVQRRRPVRQALEYEMVSWPSAIRQAQSQLQNTPALLQLPAGNLQSRAWAGQLKAQYQTPTAIVDAMLTHFRQQNYHYTLKPKPLGQQRVDDFLFDTHSGFCAHYAGAMTFVLRAAGIPSRVVVGYQGGEINPEGHYVSVHQFDAHAWVEYWQEGVGWRSVDPTAAVAPERVEAGLERALAGKEEFLDKEPLSLLRYRHVGWLNQMRMRWDSLNYSWQRWVLGYQGDVQKSFFQRLFTPSEWPKEAWYGVIFGFVVCLAEFAIKQINKARITPIERTRRVLEVFGKQAGIERQRSEGVRAYCERLVQLFPTLAEPLARYVQDYERQQYSGDNAFDRAHWQRWRKQLNQAFALAHKRGERNSKGGALLP